jgi:hypothetical protein
VFSAQLHAQRLVVHRELPDHHRSPECPVLQGKQQAVESGIEADKDVAREPEAQAEVHLQHRRHRQDPAHPENNGKVFLFRYGKKIHDKIQELIEPQFPDQSRPIRSTCGKARTSS